MEVGFVGGQEGGSTWMYPSFMLFGHGVSGGWRGRGAVASAWVQSFSLG